ncbi:hypothetical protein PoB_004214300 [Plakobranchus ocellatus]|uniref:Uncharacterized protein n=1 Tax=Plakobranchus ocellatus TaxID=259542 RepID=A0AAV4B7Q7_9GAST|nr:hypothetical protein PoB_004214300 [Plakobranchus ocellatus]
MWDKHSFVKVRNLVLPRLIMFNATRSGELARLTVNEWRKAITRIWIDPNLIEPINDPMLMPKNNKSQDKNDVSEDTEACKSEETFDASDQTGQRETTNGIAQKAGNPSELGTIKRESTKPRNIRYGKKTESQHVVTYSQKIRY